MMEPLPHPSLQDENTRLYLAALTTGQRPSSSSRPDCGRWTPLVLIVEDAYERTADPKHRGQIVSQLLDSCAKMKQYPGLAALLSSSSSSPNIPQLDLVSPSPSSSSSFPQLPESVRLPPSLSQNACPELDLYIAFSREASPEAWDDFHPFCGLWLFSVVNARRTYLPLKRKRIHGNLMLALCADSSIFAKSTTADVAKDVLRAAGLSHLLAPNRMTPQKLLSDLSGQFVPTDFATLSSDRQESIRRRLAMPGQKGLYFDEFGKFVQNMLRRNSSMSDFADLFLEFDACPPEYENATIIRGGEPIIQPYLPLLGSMTPTNLKDNARAGADFWTDGTWARFSFIVAPDPRSVPTAMKDAPLDADELPLPWPLIDALRAYNDRLGVPECHLEEQLGKKDEPNGKYTIHRENVPETACTITQEAHTAWKSYRSALKHLCLSFPHKDFHASYARLPETALRMALLMASLSNNNHIELKHWARAQELAEILRKNLHELYAQVNTTELETSYTKRIEDDILKYVHKLETEHQPPTVRDLSRYLTKVEVGKIREVVTDLARSHVLTEHKSAHGTRYSTATADAPKEPKKEPTKDHKEEDF